MLIKKDDNSKNSLVSQLTKINQHLEGRGYRWGEIFLFSQNNEYCVVIGSSPETPCVVLTASWCPSCSTSELRGRTSQISKFPHIWRLSGATWVRCTTSTLSRSPVLRTRTSCLTTRCSREPRCLGERSSRLRPSPMTSPPSEMLILRVPACCTNLCVL